MKRGEGDPARVLVIEDDDAIALVIQDLLEGEGFQIERASHGRDGLALLQSFEPQVIVLDLMMPVLDGWGFRAHQLQLSPSLAGVPVIVLSGARQAAAAGRELGATAVIVKPFKLDTLTNAVRSAVG